MERLEWLFVSSHMVTRTKYLFYKHAHGNLLLLLQAIKSQRKLIGPDALWRAQVLSAIQASFIDLDSEEQALSKIIHKVIQQAHWTCCQSKVLTCCPCLPVTSTIKWHLCQPRQNMGDNENMFTYRSLAWVIGTHMCHPWTWRPERRGMNWVFKTNPMAFLDLQ